MAGIDLTKLLQSKLDEANTRLQSNADEKARLLAQIDLLQQGLVALEKDPTAQKIVDALNITL